MKCEKWSDEHDTSVGQRNNLGPVVQKSIKANPGLKLINQSSYFFWIKVFSLFMFPGVWPWPKPKMKDKTFKQKPSLKSYKIELKFTRSNRALNNVILSPR